MRLLAIVIVARVEARIRVRMIVGGRVGVLGGGWWVQIWSVGSPRRL